MTKIKFKQPIYFLISCIIVFSGFQSDSDDNFFNHLEVALEKYNSHYYSEKAFVVTDRFVYRPGESLWFKGFVSNFSNNNASPSKDFFIRLLNSKGEEIIFRRYPLELNESSGRLVIPKSCVPGKYFLLCYTGWMKNGNPLEVYRKEIFISKYFEKRFQVEIIYDKLIYYPNDTLNAQIRITDATGKPVTDTDFDYMVGTLKKTDQKGNNTTDINGRAKIKCVLPQINDLLVLSVNIQSRKLAGAYSYIIPYLSEDPEIKFIPEGGDLVIGLKSNIAVEALNNFDKPVIFSGVITDNKGNIISLVNSNNLGLGKFEFTPSKDSSYLEINFPKGILHKYLLPTAKENGTIIKYLGTDSDSAKFRILTSESEQQHTYWVAVMNKIIVWKKELTFSKFADVGIPLKDLHSGLIQITVFNNNYKIIGERLINNRNLSEELKVTTDRQFYHNRQRVSVRIETPEKLANNELAVSVSLKSLAKNEQKKDFNSLTYINYDPEPASIKKMDLKDDLNILSGKFRIIDWENLVFSKEERDSFLSYNGLTGKIYDKKENVAKHAKVRVTHFPTFRLYETQTDENGFFNVLFGSDIIDYKFLNIDAYDASGKINLSAKIDYDFVKKVDDLFSDNYKENQKEKISDLQYFGEPDMIYVLRYGPGKFRKSKSESRKKYNPYQYTNYNDVLEIIQDIEPYKIKENKIIFQDKIDSTLRKEGTLIVINGLLKGDNIEILKNVLPSDITNINISKSLIDIHKYTPLNFNGVIEITTIQGMSRYKQSNILIGPNALNPERGFYSPDYSVESTNSADNRKTLYWNPKINISQGNTTTITFYTSDIKGIYYGYVSGVDMNGKVLESEFSFKVE